MLFSKNMTAVEWFVKGLEERGVRWMATLCGHGLDPLFHAARKAGLRLVDARNEQTAGYMAEAYGKLTRRPGVCAVSSGVAHINALTGVTNAWFDGAPMLLITGAGSHITAGMGHFQDMDQVAVARPVTKFARTVDVAERAVEILDDALRLAGAAPPGPVHLTFPMDVQNTEVARMVRPMGLARCAAAPPEEVDLGRYERPLIVAGSGVWYGGEGEALLRFAEEFAIPLVVPIWDRGFIDRPSPVFMGVIGAATGGPSLLHDADCILMAGAVPDYRVQFLQPPQVRENARVVYDWKGARGGKPHTTWLEEARKRRAQFRRGIEQAGARQAEAGMHAVDIMTALGKVMDDQTVLLIDGGSTGQWAHQLLCDRYPGHWLTCGRSGVVGWGIGGAMGARMAYPDRPVILLSGDGAFTFTVAELECAVRQKLHFVAVVSDDQGWGITRTGHERQFGEPIASSLGPIAFNRLAESLGARGVVVTRPEELVPALERALAEPAVTVLHVPVVGGYPA